MTKLNNGKFGGYSPIRMKIGT